MREYLRIDRSLLGKKQSNFIIKFPNYQQFEYFAFSAPFSFGWKVVPQNVYGTQRKKNGH